MSDRKRITDLINIKKANDLGLNRHCGEKHYAWNGGTHHKG